MGVAREPRMREAVLTPPRSGRPGLRRDSRPAPAGDPPSGPDPGALLFPPEVETRAPQPRVRAPLRVRRSARDAEDTRSRERRHGAASSSRSPAPAVDARPRPAGLGVRIAAGCCDLALLAGLDALVVWLTLRLTGLDLQSVGALPRLPLAAFLCLLDAGYVAGLTAAGGQTIGKMAWGLRVADEGGGAVSLPRALARTFWTPVSMTVGIVWIFLGREGRPLHDVLSGTRVMAVPPPPQASPEGGAA